MARHGCLEQFLLSLYFQKEILYLFPLQSFFQHLLFSSSHPIHSPSSIPPSFPILRFFPPQPFSHLHREMKTSQWEWIGIWEWCVCVCVFVFKCVSMLYDTLVGRWEGGSLLCNLLRPTILPHLCVSLHRFALSHTHLPSLSHFTVSLLRSPCTSSSTSTYLSFSDNSSPYIALLSQYQATRNLWSVGWHSLYPHIDTSGAPHKYTQLKTTRSKPVNS